MGGLGVLDLQKMNEALLAKWIWRLENSSGLWQSIVKSKYVKNKPIISVKKRPSDSHFWKGLLSVRDKYYNYCKKNIGDGKSSSFWKNIWCGNVKLADKYPNLFEVAYDKDITVHKVISSNFQMLTFRRRLIGDLGEAYSDLMEHCSQVLLSDNDDSSKWLLGCKGFSVKSFYKMLKNSMIEVPLNFLWKTRLPHKIKVFLWLVRNNKILTKDNLVKRHWHGNPDCIFSGLLESIDHLFFHCPVARFIWRIIQIAFKLSSTPKDTTDLFGPWINSFYKTEKKLILFGCGAVIWAIWRTRNDCCFNAKLIDDPCDFLLLLLD
jgi:hypothetical protein